MQRDAVATADVPKFFDVQKLEEADFRVAERDYGPKETIFMPGDPADRLYLLLGGMVRVCKAYGNYSQATTALLKDTGGFGEFDLFGGGSQTSSAQAMTGCRVASIRKIDLRFAMKHHPGLALELFCLFSERLRHSEQAIDNLLQRRVAARLITLLPRLAQRFDGQADGCPETVIPLTHGELAEMIASTREAVSKALKELSLEGLIELGKKNIRVKDRASLEARAAGTA